MRRLNQKNSPDVTLEVECVNRLYLNLYQPLLQTPGGAAHFFRTIRGNAVPSPVLMAPITQNLVAAIEAFAEANGIDLIRFEKGERTQPYLKQWHGGEGALYTGKAQEKARVLRTQAQVDPNTGNRTPSLAFATALPNNDGTPSGEGRGASWNEF